MISSLSPKLESWDLGVNKHRCFIGSRFSVARRERERSCKPIPRRLLSASKLSLWSRSPITHRPRHISILGHLFRDLSIQTARTSKETFINIFSRAINHFYSRRRSTSIELSLCCFLLFSDRHEIYFKFILILSRESGARTGDKKSSAKLSFDY